VSIGTTLLAIALDPTRHRCDCLRRARDPRGQFNSPRPVDEHPLMDGLARTLLLCVPRFPSSPVFRPFWLRGLLGLRTLDECNRPEAASGPYTIEACALTRRGIIARPLLSQSVALNISRIPNAAEQR
jgi:hypothetical protein